MRRSYMSFDDKVTDMPATLPMLPVRDIVVFPYMILPLFVGREASIRSVEEALAKNRLIFLASQKEITEENPTPESIYQVGTIAKIMRMRKLSDGRVKILIQGEAKGRIKSFSKTSPYLEVIVEKIVVRFQKVPTVKFEVFFGQAKSKMKKIIALGRVLS